MFLLPHSLYCLLLTQSPLLTPPRIFLSSLTLTCLFISSHTHTDAHSVHIIALLAKQANSLPTFWGFLAKYSKCLGAYQLYYARQKVAKLTNACRTPSSCPTHPPPPSSLSLSLAAAGRVKVEHQQRKLFQCPTCCACLSVCVCLSVCWCVPEYACVCVCASPCLSAASFVLFSAVFVCLIRATCS